MQIFLNMKFDHRGHWRSRSYGQLLFSLYISFYLSIYLVFYDIINWYKTLIKIRAKAVFQSFFFSSPFFLLFLSVSLSVLSFSHFPNILCVSLFSLSRSFFFTSLSFSVSLSVFLCLSFCLSLSLFLSFSVSLSVLSLSHLSNVLSVSPPSFLCLSYSLSFYLFINVASVCIKQHTHAGSMT